MTAPWKIFSITSVFLEKVKAGREESERHGTLTQEELEKRLSKWLAE